MRHPIAWQDPDFYDAARSRPSCERVFDICHGCRRCFNLCDSFPRLFDMIDEGPTGELNGVPREKYGEVVEACTLCDMCFMTKCPYVPPHEFNIDFPHLMLRHRAAEEKQGKIPLKDRALAETDRNGKLGAPVAPLDQLGGQAREQADAADAWKRSPASIATPRCRNSTAQTFAARAKRRAGTIPTRPRPPSAARPCSMQPASSITTTRASARRRRPCWRRTASRRRCLSRNAAACRRWSRASCRASPARPRVARALSLIEQGYDIVALMPSCALMLKFEWPLLLPGDADVKRLSDATFDLTEYVVDIAKKEGLAPGSARSTAASACISPAMRGRRNGRRKRPRCCGCCPKPSRCDRALLRPWRKLGR